ncbi:ubiquitin C-terminal hydrolase L3 [Marasmius fiardii PR-910]|nr:ubiquitin C-terminal hydrolase L3 [Marasmius fiardii PR-910]
MSSDSRKKYIPLESNPEVFTKLIKSLGASGLEFQEIYSLGDDLLETISRPVLALVILFPAIGERYEKDLEEERATGMAYDGSGEGEDVIWFRQTIDLACGLYAILHSVSNGPARNYIGTSLHTAFYPYSFILSYTESGSPIERLLKICLPLKPYERALALEASHELEEIHNVAGKEGDTDFSLDSDDVDYHYVSFVQSNKSGRLYELDGMKSGPIDTGLILGEGEDVLSKPVLELVKEFIGRESSKYQSDGFNMMALVPSSNC